MRQHASISGLAPHTASLPSTLEGLLHVSVDRQADLLLVGQHLQDCCMQAANGALVWGHQHLCTACRLESLVEPLLKRTEQPCRDCMKDAGVSASEINEVLLVGGQTRMPRVSWPHHSGLGHNLIQKTKLSFEGRLPAAAAGGLCRRSWALCMPQSWRVNLSGCLQQWRLASRLPHQRWSQPLCSTAGLAGNTWIPHTSCMVQWHSLGEHSSQMPYPICPCQGHAVSEAAC